MAMSGLHCPFNADFVIEASFVLSRARAVGTSPLTRDGTVGVVQVGVVVLVLLVVVLLLLLLVGSGSGSLNPKSLSLVSSSCGS